MHARVLCTIAVLIAMLFGSPASAKRVQIFSDAADLLSALDTDDLKVLSRAIAAIENAPTPLVASAHPGPDFADVLFVAGRACEDRLYDPARAFALYDRIVREFPDAGVSIAAGRRATMLRGTREHAREAAQLAQLMATADALPAAQVEQRASELAAGHWPGAIDAALFLADWLCRTSRFSDAQARYGKLLVDAPDAEQSHRARRNAAGCAIDAKNWSLAETLTAQLGTDDVDEAVRTSLLDTIAMGRRREALYAASSVAWLVAAFALLASLVEAMLRGGMRLPAFKPPVEVLYIAPVALVVIVASFVIDRLIASAVVQISVAGFVAAWVSGTTLDLLRQRGRGVRARALVHVLACGALVLAVGYIAMTRDGLLDMLGETVKFGPGS